MLPCGASAIPGGKRNINDLQEPFANQRGGRERRAKLRFRVFALRAIVIARVRVLKVAANDSHHFGGRAVLIVPCEKRLQIFDFALTRRTVALSVIEEKEDVRRLVFQLFSNVRERGIISTARIQDRDRSVIIQIEILPAKKFQQNFAALFRSLGREEGGNDFLDWEFVRSGQDKTRRTLLKKQFLQRGELTQDRLLNRGRKLPEKPSSRSMMCRRSG